MSQPAARQATRNNARRDFYERIGGLSMAPLWESLHQLVPPKPAPRYQAAHWDYDRVRPFLMESGSLITAKEAVRRVLILENPVSMKLFDAFSAACRARAAARLAPPLRAAAE